MHASAQQDAPALGQSAERALVKAMVSAIVERADLIAAAGGSGAPGAPAALDLSDPATLGCLLALVRKALKPRGWGVTLCLANTGAGWQLGYLAGGEWFSPLGTIHRTEAAALVAALEVAP
jgi:hypothetical protein